MCKGSGGGMQVAAGMIKIEHQLFRVPAQPRHEVRRSVAQAHIASLRITFFDRGDFPLHRRPEGTLALTLVFRRSGGGINAPEPFTGAVIQRDRSDHGDTPFPHAILASVRRRGVVRTCAHQHTGSVHTDRYRDHLFRWRQARAVGDGHRRFSQRSHQSGEALHEIKADAAGVIGAQIPDNFSRRQFHQFAADHLRELRGGRTNEAGGPVQGIMTNPAET